MQNCICVVVSVFSTTLWRKSIFFSLGKSPDVVWNWQAGLGLKDLLKEFVHGVEEHLPQQVLKNSRRCQGEPMNTGGLVVIQVWCSVYWQWRFALWGDGRGLLVNWQSLLQLILKIIFTRPNRKKEATKNDEYKLYVHASEGQSYWSLLMNFEQ